MPTHEEDELFLDQYRKLTREQRALFRRAARELSEDADSGQFRASLRAHPMKGQKDLWEMTWEGNDGRAMFTYTQSHLPGKRHIIWRRIGSHGIYKK